MSQTVLLYTGAGLTFLWGVAHLIPTRAVVRGHGTRGKAGLYSG